MSKEEQIRLMAASIYGGIVGSSPNSLHTALTKLAIRRALQIYDEVPSLMNRLEEERYEERYEGVEDE